jgi:hypothetical protein
VLAIPVNDVPRCHGLVVKSPPSRMLRGIASCEPTVLLDAVSCANVAVPGVKPEAAVIDCTCNRTPPGEVWLTAITMSPTSMPFDVASVM